MFLRKAASWSLRALKTSMGASDDALMSVGTKEEEVERVVDVMRDLSVCRVERREVDGEEIMGIRIHDLIHDYCVAQAEKHEGLRHWHKQVVEGYRRRYKIWGGSDGNVRWWSEEVVDDSYIYSKIWQGIW